MSGDEYGYSNPVVSKTCPLCGERFKGDETVKGELCYMCDKNASECITCEELFLPKCEEEIRCKDCQLDYEDYLRERAGEMDIKPKT